MASLGRPDCPSFTTLALPLLNPAAHFFTVLKEKNSFPRVSMKYSWISLGGIPFFLSYRSTWSPLWFQLSLFCKCIASFSLTSALHKEPSMTACLTHSQCPSIRSNDRQTKILIQQFSTKHIRPRTFWSHLVRRNWRSNGDFELRRESWLRCL